MSSLRTKEGNAKLIKDSVMRVNENTFAVPSQTRPGKAHIITNETSKEDVLVPNELLLEVAYLMNPATNISGTETERRKHTVLTALWNCANEEIKLNCTCENHKYHPNESCKHMLAVQMKIEEGDI